LFVRKEDSMFSFLQSVDEPDLAFVMIMPELVVDDYFVKLNPDEIDLLQIESPVDCCVFCYCNGAGGRGSHDCKSAGPP